MSTISLCCDFKDEELNAEAVYNCVKDIVNEWIVMDSGSTDATIEICRDLGARVYQITHPLFVGGYGSMRTLTAHLSKCDWVLILDGDERILKEDALKIKALAETEHDFICLIRQHYRKFDMSIIEAPNNELLTNPTTEQQIQNMKAHPDWQPRFFRNKPEIRFERMVHERVVGYKNMLMDLNNPVIRHFGFLKTDPRLEAIAEMCDVLWQADQENTNSYIEENKFGHATTAPSWQLFWEKKQREGQKKRDAKWMKEYRRYWK